MNSEHALQAIHDNLELLEHSILDSQQKLRSGGDVAVFGNIIHRFANNLKTDAPNIKEQEAVTLIYETEQAMSQIVTGGTPLTLPLLDGCLDAVLTIRKTLSNRGNKKTTSDITEVIHEALALMRAQEEIANRQARKEKVVPIVPRTATVLSGEESFRTLIIDNDFLNRSNVGLLVNSYGDYEVATDGVEGFMSFLLAIEEKRPFQLVVINAGLEKISERRLLKNFRQVEAERNTPPEDAVRVILTTRGEPSEKQLKSFSTSNEIISSMQLDELMLQEIVKRFKLI